MERFSIIKRSGFVLLLIGIITSGGLFTNQALSQTARNPVLEFCTGTWCQWCPCGDQVIHDILAAHPNTIVLAYHGPANTSSDPYSFFPGNPILSSLGFSAYPTGIIDRTSGIVSRNVWMTNVESRLNAPATVEIEIPTRSYDPNTREYNATINFTAMTNLNGNYKYNMILLEDGIVHSQTSNNTCTPGQTTLPNYVHEWTVRTMMNGPLGEEVKNGSWNQGEVVTKDLTYTIPVPSPPAVDIIPDSCQVVVMIYEVGSPLNSGAEIQQAEEWSMIPPDFAASLGAQTTDFLGSASATAQHNIVLKNEGLQTDTYYLSLDFEGPSGWNQTFTTVNGSHTQGEVDSLEIAAGDSAMITVEVSANSVVGYGETMLNFWSTNSPSTFGSTTMRFATFGLPVLVVDDEPEDYEHYAADALDHIGQNHGVVASDAVQGIAPGDLSSFDKIIWMTALAEPALTEDEMNALKGYLDNGGNLYLNGVDVAYFLADPASPYYTTGSLDFYTDYLHADYVKRIYTFLTVDGISGDPITDGISAMGLFGGTGASTINFQTGKYPNQIDAGDSYAAPIFTFFSRPNDYAGIRADHNGTNGDGRVVFTTFGFETIADSADRDLLMQRVLDWFDSPTAIGDSDPAAAVNKFELKSNYPNPFNPSTTISYSLPAIDGSKNVTLVIYNQLGQKVRTLVNQPQSTGSYELTWNGLDDAGKPAASGVYFYRLRYGDHQATQKMLLLR